MLRKRRGHHYGDGRRDVVAFLREWTADEYPATKFAHATCTCKKRRFAVQLDDGAGVCVRTCPGCGDRRPIADGADYLEEAELDECQCPCGSECFELTVGVALYADSDDVKWLYVGLRCASCSLVACYGDWKNEAGDYRELLARV